MSSRDATGTEAMVRVRRGRNPWRWLPALFLLVASVGASLWLLVAGNLDLRALSDYRDWAVAQVEATPILAGMALFGLYALVATLSVPITGLLTVVAGFLFGPWIATAWIVAAATLGATLVFLAARSALYEPLAARAGPWLRRMEADFAEDALCYLLVLRLVPIFPFCTVNLAVGILGMALRPYVIGTLIGMVPSTLIIAALGSGLGDVLEGGRIPSAGVLLDPALMGPLFGLALLALLPILYKHRRRRSEGRARPR